MATALALAAAPAAALGLGQIQVKSKVDQPLLAEIPIVSSDPAELEQLQARLASPDTFAPHRAGAADGRRGRPGLQRRPRRSRAARSSASPATRRCTSRW